MITLLTETAFAARKRERLLDFQAYQTEAEDLIRRLPNAARKLSDPDWLAGRDEAALMRLTYARADYGLDLLTLSYSAGADVESLQAFFPALLGYVEEYALYSEALNRTPEELRTQRAHIPIADLAYQDANRLLCFAILLGWQEYVPRIMAIIEYKNPRDAMLERLASIHTARPQPLPNGCTRSLPYSRTLAIFDARPADRAELMRSYLEGWYRASRDEPYYNAHSIGNQFLGYWSWEAAAITVALRIDDAPYRDHRCYPRDMADLGRTKATADTLFTPETRAIAGDACPIAGTWESIGFPTRRVEYVKEAAMRDLGSPYGSTVWRLIEINGSEIHST
jgi:hypothetical protein